MPQGDEMKMSAEQARQLLGVSDDAAAELIRAAYLEQVRRHPPDRDPEQFERIRDAYELLRDPHLRARRVLEGPNPSAPLVSLLEGLPQQRRFAGAEMWLKVLKDRKAGGS
jgi:hypothetical protein